MPGTSRVTTPLLSSSPLFLSTPRCPDTMKLNAAASRIYLDVSVLPSEQSRADDDADEENDSTRKKNGGNRICRNRYTGPPNATWPQEMRNPPLPPPPVPLPPQWISRAFVESMAPLSPLFFTQVSRVRSHVREIPFFCTVVGESARFTCAGVGQFQGDDFLKRTSDCWELKFGWWIRG